jgi:rare lipoprotein A
MLVLGCAAATLALGGCAQQPSQHVAHSNEYFPASVYGPASPRVVADGDPIPHGGGTYLVGKPYTIAGKTYYPSEKQYAAVGLASWYGDAFHGRRTANGEIYDRTSISAAHPTMPLPSYARVTNLRNSRSIIVRVNDRGPYAAGRIMDVSSRVAEELDFRHLGTTKVKVEYVGPASLAGSDDRKLLATLRIDGTPAQFDGARPPTLIAQAPPPVQTAAAETPVPPAPPAADPGITTPVASSERNFGVIAAVPLPPSRPFDLGTIPGAGVPIGAR